MLELSAAGGKSRYRFRHANRDSLLAEAARLGLELPWSDDVAPLLESLDVCARRMPNRLAVQPMEGYDAAADGAPSELTFRRYRRYASGGAGLIWFEATAVVSEGRSNPHQLYLNKDTGSAFGRLVEATRQTARQAFGSDHCPLLVLQLTDSGHWSRPGERRAPRIVHHNPDLDELVEVDSEYPLMSDDELDRLQDDFVRAAHLAAEAGFDAVDIKACHGYLVSELLAAFTRDGRYGGLLENRGRFLIDVVKRVREEVPALLVACRLNAYDGLPFPYSFGVHRENSSVPDLREPAQLLRNLKGAGVVLANVSIGVPYRKPHLGRPFLRPVRGTAPSPENPLVGVSRLLDIAARMHQSVDPVPLVGTGYSYLRHYFPHVAAASVSNGDVSIAGVGRMAFAYPDFARDLLDHGRLDPEKRCLACSGCTELMRAGGPTGCVVRDREFYRLPRRGRR